MILKELIRQSNLKVNDAVTDDYWVDRFNEALADLAPVLLLEGVKSTQLEVITPVALPRDVLNDRIIMCRLGANLPRVALDDFDTTGYKIFDNSIDLQGRFSLPDTLTIWYQRTPKSLSLDDMEAEPEIPEPYQHALKYYAVAKWWQTELEPDFESSYWRDYVDIKQQLAYYINKKSRRYTDLTLRTR